MEQAKAKNQSVCRITVNGIDSLDPSLTQSYLGNDMGNIPAILKDETAPDPDPFARFGVWVSGGKKGTILLFIQRFISL